MRQIDLDAGEYVRVSRSGSPSLLRLEVGWEDEESGGLSSVFLGGEKLDELIRSLDHLRSDLEPVDSD